MPGAPPFTLSLSCDALASKVTAWPRSDEFGDDVKDAVGGAVALATSICWMFDGSAANGFDAQLPKSAVTRYAYVPSDLPLIAYVVPVTVASVSNAAPAWMRMLSTDHPWYAGAERLSSLTRRKRRRTSCPANGLRSMLRWPVKLPV